MDDFRAFIERLAVPKISIIIPAYNVSAFIGQTLESVLNNKADMEIIVVDDASTDNTCDIVEIYATTHKNITLIRSDINAGPGVARNRAIEIMTGEYCLFQDADDILVEGAIDYVLAKMDETNVDVSVFKYSLLRSMHGQPEEMSDSKIIWDNAIGDQESVVLQLDAAPLFLITVNYPWNKIYRSSFIRSANILFSTARINEDILPHWATYMRAGRFLALNKSLAIHRLIPGRDQHTSVQDERRLDIFVAFRDAERLFDENSDFRRKYFHLFLFFKAGLLRWAQGNLQPHLQGIFREMTAYAYRNFTDEDFHRVYSVMPDVAMTSYRLKYAPHTLGQ